jgi:hypothetical protein
VPECTAPGPDIVAAKVKDHEDALAAITTMDDEISYPPDDWNSDGHSTMDERWARAGRQRRGSDGPDGPPHAPRTMARAATPTRIVRPMLR